MNFVDFLMDNYIWIIVIILITIITIIGFLADKKKNNKSKEEQPINNQNFNTIQPENMNVMPQPMQNMNNQEMNMQNGMNNMNFNNQMPQTSSSPAANQSLMQNNVLPDSAQINSILSTLYVLLSFPLISNMFKPPCK